MPKHPAPEFSGILVLDKPQGFTSHDAIAKLRGMYGTRQIGHTGTLDPLATGVLPILCGRAVKASEYLSAHDKRYEAVFRLGYVSDTGDADGNVSPTGKAIPDAKAVFAAVQAMLGKQMQTPPMTSAVKVDGKKLLDYARAGKTVEVEPRPIEIYAASAAQLSDAEFSLSLHVSKGTYIRTVITDLGEKLGCGAMMTALRRTQSGCFTLAGAYTLEEVQAMTIEERIAALRPVEEAFGDLPRVTPPAFYATLAHNGCEIYQKKIKTDFPVGTRVRLCDADGFFAVGEVRMYKDGTAVKPIKLLKL